MHLDPSGRSARVSCATAPGRARIRHPDAYQEPRPQAKHLKPIPKPGKTQLTSRRIVLTHLSADMLAHEGHVDFDVAYDGFAVAP
jgi:hypothetical protein